MNNIMTIPDARQVLSALPGNYLLLDTVFTITAVSNDYCNAQATVPGQLTGTVIADEYGLHRSLQEVIDSKQTVQIQSAILTPVLNEQGNVSAIIYKSAIGISEVDKLRTTVEQLNKELETFSYSVSHDLRAPLRAVLGFARILEEDYSPALGDGGRRLLSTISSNAARMGTLIDGLLVYSRTGRRAISPGHIDMNVLTDAVLRDINRTTDNNTNVIIGDLQPVVADAALMTQVMTSLLDNAMKFSAGEQLPLVEIQSKVVDCEAVFSVKDNGVGFNMRYADKLFGIFQRLHTTDEFEGTGVGLAVVQRIISRHGGRVWIESIPGEGTTAFFSLPLK